MPGWKRPFDLIVAAGGLLLFGPLMLLIALAIKLDSPGPAFFRQQRVGRGGVPFAIHKFRTMRTEPVDTGAQITVGDDPRITRIGGWLRRRKLDELAQLIDVLQGTMSIVGPRPEVPRYVALYDPQLRARVLAVKPGITDPASLQFRGESELLARAADPQREYVEVVMPRKLEMAAQYVQQMSLAGDVTILWRTLCVLARRP